MWKCPCCGLPRFHAGRMSSGPHPETPPRNPETLPRNPTPKPHPETPNPETLKSPNRGVCMWKCPCCGVPRYHAGRMSSGPHPETPKPHPETPTPKPWSLQIEECACGSVLAVACHVTMRGACHQDPTPKPRNPTPKPHPEAPPRNPTPKRSVHVEVSLLWRATLPCGAHVITTPPRNPTLKPLHV